MEMIYLEIKCFITVENKNKSSKLMSKSFNRFCFTSSSWSCSDVKEADYFCSRIAA